MLKKEALEADGFLVLVQGRRPRGIELQAIENDARLDNSGSRQKLKVESNSVLFKKKPLLYYAHNYNEPSGYIDEEL